MRLLPSEADIQKSILDYLQARGIFAFRQNAGAVNANQYVNGMASTNPNDFCAAESLPRADLTSMARNWPMRIVSLVDGMKKVKEAPQGPEAGLA